MLKPSGSSSPAGEGGLPIGRGLLQDAVDPGCTYVCAVGRHPAPRGHSRGHQAHRGHTPRAHPESAPREGAAEWWTLCKTEGDFPGKGGLTLERLWEDGEGMVICWHLLRPQHCAKRYVCERSKFSQRGTQQHLHFTDADMEA